MTMLSDREIRGDLSQALQEAQKGDQTAWETLFRSVIPRFAEWSDAGSTAR